MGTDDDKPLGEKAARILAQVIEALPEEERLQVIHDLKEQIVERHRRYAWTIFDLTPEFIADPENLPMLALLDTGIVAGIQASLRHTASKQPPDEAPPFPEFRKMATDHAVQLMKVDPAKAQEYADWKARFNLTEADPLYPPEG